MRSVIYKFECERCSAKVEGRSDNLPKNWRSVEGVDLCGECYVLLANWLGKPYQGLLPNLGLAQVLCINHSAYDMMISELPTMLNIAELAAYVEKYNIQMPVGWKDVVESLSNTRKAIEDVIDSSVKVVY